MRYNEVLKERHENFRNDTAFKIEEAIGVIKSFEGENAVITAKKILENSDLSRSVLYKEHSLKIWNPSLWEERYGDGKDVVRKIEKKFDEEFASLQNEMESLKKKMKKLEKQNSSLSEQLSNESKRSDVYKMDLEESEKKNQKLLAECQRLQNKLYSHGINE